MSKNIQNQKAAYQKNKKGFTKEFANQLGFKITQVEFIDNNDIFNELALNLPSIKNVIQAEYADIHSLVQVARNNRYKLKYHNCITFFLPDGSHIRFSPYKDGLELSRLYVVEENQNQGYGTGLMELFLVYLQETLEDMPFIIAEITGAVGYGDNRQDSTIEDQQKFYEKFGFQAIDAQKGCKTLLRPAGLKL